MYSTRKLGVKLRRMRVARALTHLRDVSSVLAFERIKAEQTSAFARLKIVKKVFGELYRYKEERLAMTHKKVHAQALHSHNLLIKGFHGLL